MKKTIFLFFGLAVISTLFYCNRNEMSLDESSSPKIHPTNLIKVENSTI